MSAGAGAPDVGARTFDERAMAAMDGVDDHEDTLVSVSASHCHDCAPCDYEGIRVAAFWALGEITRLRAALAETREGWRDIATAPRDSSRVLVAYKGLHGWRVLEAWWRLAYDGASPEMCWWCYGGDKKLYDASIHKVGATHWMPLPAPPTTQEEP